MTVEYPADTAQPADSTSWYLTRPCRSFAEAVRDISRNRDLPEYVFDELQHHRHSAVIVELAEVRAALRRRK